MQSKRRYKRYRLDLIEVHGRMSLSDKVEVLDISLGGVALKADRRLNIGREYLLKLEEEGKTIEVRGTVVRSELIGIEARANGEKVSIYTAGMTFKDGSIEKIADFLKPIEQHKKGTVPDELDQRSYVRFDITASREKVLSYPSQFMVKALSLGGMLIKTSDCLGVENKVPMELSLYEGSAVNFVGRVASCQALDDEGNAQYEIGVEFADLTEKDKLLLKTFIDYLSTIESGTGTA